MNKQFVERHLVACDKIIQQITERVKGTKFKHAIGDVTVSSEGLHALIHFDCDINV